MTGYLYVATRFNRFRENLRLTDAQRTDGITKHTGVRSWLNSHYYGTSSGYDNSSLVGSWGKSTEIRPPRDIDVLFALPWSVHERYERRPYGTNKQSELLQEIKTVLQRTYTTTQMRADGQVVVVPFASYAVEVVPAFALMSGKYWICNTHDGGSYKETDPVAEQNKVRASNDATVGHTRSNSNDEVLAGLLQRPAELLPHRTARHRLSGRLALRRQEYCIL